MNNSFFNSIKYFLFMISFFFWTPYWNDTFIPNENLIKEAIYNNVMDAGGTMSSSGFNEMWKQLQFSIGDQ